MDEKVSVEFTVKEGYTVFEVTECPQCFDFLTVGPVVTTLNDVVGDIVGVVQGEEAAVGIQALNIKTLAGFEYGASLNCFRIEEELLRYSEYEIVSAGEILLKDCTRGAFGTGACAHPKGSSVYRLTDYPYNTLFPDIHLQDEFSDRIADLFNRTGVKQISFDGLEGCEWTGEGQYGINRFCMRCWAGS